MKVLKFGGSSVAKPERIEHIYSIIHPRINSGEQLAIVFSAFGGVTDQLITMIEMASQGKSEYTDVLLECKERHHSAVQELIKDGTIDACIQQVDLLFQKLENILKGVFLLREASGASFDYVMSFGERLSNLIISLYFSSRQIPSSFIDARQVIVTNSVYRSAIVYLEDSFQNIKNTWSENKDKTLIVTGFVASDLKGKTTTLGRGGSDYTAALFAAALDAEALEIWTDVDGVLTTNPKIVKQAYPIKQMSYTEAMEMSHFGAKVIYPPTIQPVLEKGIPTYIRNTFNPEYIGTLIHKETDKNNGLIKGLSSLGGISLITLSGAGMQGVPGVAARLFNSLANNSINIILITQASSEHSICIAVKEENSGLAKGVLEDEFSREIELKKIDSILIDEKISLIAVVGEAMKEQPGIAGKIFSILGRNGINIEAIAQGSSELNISFAIKSIDETKALNLIHDTFFKNTLKTMNLFVVGTGLIGSTLLQQIKENSEKTLQKSGVEFKLIGVSNSRKMYFQEEGIDLESWKEELDNSEIAANPKEFVQRMIDLNMANSIFIDNTASTSIPDYYSNVLNSSISISTPNKIASSADFKFYEELKNLAKKRNTKFMTETNVGAGLPIISTIHSLRNSGDEIIKIEAVLSGSLSYIFNKYTSQDNFHDIVKEAQELGYTEPDPREDLGGSDVRRKIVILARESGYNLEISQVELNNLLPDECIQAESIDLFFESLVTQQDHFSKLIGKAESENKRLRFIANYENGKAKVGIQSVDSRSPFYNLSGSDNMIAIYTSRYKTSPLVIQGPGAGANVTAAGVFSELIQIANERFDY